MPFKNGPRDILNFSRRTKAARCPYRVVTLPPVAYNFPSATSSYFSSSAASFTQQTLDCMPILTDCSYCLLLQFDNGDLRDHSPGPPLPAQCSDRSASLLGSMEVVEVYSAPYSSP